MKPIFVMLLVLLVAGCGDKSAPSGNTTPAPQATTAAAENPAPEPEPAPEPAPAPAPEPELPPLPEGAAFEEKLRRVESLQADARFHEAIQLCRELRGQSDGEQAARVGRMLTQLRDYQSTAMRLNLPFAMRKLRTDTPAVYLDVARDKLAEAGEVGRIYLRKAIRQRRGNGVANEAAALLIYEAGADCVPFLVAQLQDPPDEPLLGTIIEGIVREAEAPPLATLLAVMRFRRTEAAAPYADALDGMLRDVTERPVEAGALAPLYERVAADAAFAARDEAELLGLFYDGASRDDEAFNAMLGGDERLAELRAYAARAAAANEAALAAWGQELAVAFSPIDYGALRKGLLAWWSFNVIEDGKLPDRSGRGHAARRVGDREPELATGRVGKCLRFNAKWDSFVESLPLRSKAFRYLHRKSYSVAAWIHPTALPTGKQPDIHAGIFAKNGWHLGLFMETDGDLHYSHFYDHRKGQTVSADTGVPLGRWTHVAASVDQEARELRIFVDGRLVKKQAIKPGYDRQHDDEQVRIGAARQARHRWAYRFTGKIDEVAIYRRALTESDVGHLYRLTSPAAVRALAP